MLAVCLAHCFFNFMLLDYFLKYSGDRDSKEQLSLAKRGSFSYTALFSMAHLAKRLKKQQGNVHPRGAEYRGFHIPTYCQPSTGIRLGGITGSLDASGKCCMPERHEQHDLGAAQGARSLSSWQGQLTWCAARRVTVSFTHLVALTRAARLLASVGVQAGWIDCQSHLKCV